MPRYQCTHSFVGVAVDSRLQKFLLGIQLLACCAGARGRPSVYSPPHWGVHITPSGVYLQSGGVGQGGGGVVAGGRAPDFGQQGGRRHQYQMTGVSLDNGGCIVETHIVVDRCWFFLCILRCCMAIGRFQVAFVEARKESLPKENAEAVQRLLYPARTGVRLGATAAPDGGFRNLIYPLGP